MINVHLDKRRDIGLGDIVSAVTRFFGIQTCAPCEQRKTFLNTVRIPVPSLRVGPFAVGPAYEHRDMEGWK